MDLIYQYYRLMPGSLDEIEDMWEMVKNILSTVTEEWRKPDKGIWEIRGRSRQFVSSKVMCWVALDRGAKVADLLGKNEYGRRWRREADDIRDDVMKNGWKEEIGSFSQAYDNLALDSSLLLMEPYGFIEATDPRYSRTVRAVKEALLHDGLMYRYNSEDDFGMPTYGLQPAACGSSEIVYDPVPGKSGMQDGKKRPYHERLLYHDGGTPADRSIGVPHYG